MKMIKNIIIHTIVLFSFLTAAESEQVENEKYSFIKDIYSQSWALVIGINAYQNVEPLNYAVNDAVAVKDMLVEKYGFKETNIRLILDEEATKDNIIKGFSDILTQAKEKDRVVVFYAGHGETYKLPSGGDMGYLIPVDGNLDNLY
ncbi:MAG: caspase family protein, partial [Candidatus Marinimicrobia bacterium]|nr:caspase family protein [Candidatus Neomarinimicrobiota bacterium]